MPIPTFPINAVSRVLHSRRMLAALLAAFPAAHAGFAADYIVPRDVYVAPQSATGEVLTRSAGSSTLHFGDIDLFPHAAVTGLYDDNVLISSTDPISDFQWILAPGLTVTGGDIASYFPNSVTLEQIRGLLNYSLLDDSSRPQRFFAVDYTPSFNLFTENSRFNNVDHSARFSGGYSFAKLAIGLDQDFTRADVKESQIGTRITTITYDTRLRTRYEFTDRNSVEVNGRYYRHEYGDPLYHGYQEFRNEDWFNRKIGEKLALGLGAAFGLVLPEVNKDQTYQQLLARAAFRLTDKLNLRSDIGVEFRQYESGADDTISPVFTITAIYHPRENTTFTLEAHRGDQPSPQTGYNYTRTGFSVGARQLVFGRLYAGLSAGYENIEYSQVDAATAPNRTDSYASLGVSLDYEFNPHWTTSLFYTYHWHDSTSGLNTYDNNIVGIQVLWRF